MSSAATRTVLSRGDVVVFGTTSLVMAASPEDTVAVKRVAAIEGDTVEAAFGTILVNGRKYEGMQYSLAMSSEQSQSSESKSLERRDDWKPEWARLGSMSVTRQVVPVGHVFVLGDNLASSVDSRRFGVIPTSAVKGRVLFAHFKRGWIGL
jgi:signal peptidase I